MATDNDVHQKVRGRALAPFIAAAMLAALTVPFALTASADTTTTDDPGEAGTVVLSDGDGFVPSARYYGINRFDTARLIAEEGFHPSDTVLLARGGLYPDSLSGNFLAGQLDAPIVLTNDTPATEPNTETLDAIEHVGANRVVILGREAAVSNETEQFLIDAGYDVDRIGGLDRFETAALIATEPGNNYGDLGAQGRTAIVASGENFPDALVAGAISYDGQFPLLLTNRDFLTPVTQQALDALAIEHVVIAGGEAAVGTQVQEDIEADGITVERVNGPARIETAVELAEWARANLGWAFSHLNFATGTNFPDALTIGPHAGEERSPILLTNGADDLDSTGNALEEWLPDHACEIGSVDIAGGPVAISEPLEDEIRERATSSGACALSLTPETATNITAESHTVTASVTTNGGTGIDGETVRFEVWRDREQPGDDEYDLVTFGTDETGDDQSNEGPYAPGEDEGEATFTYFNPQPGPGPPGAEEEAHDVIIACVVADPIDECEAGGDAAPGAVEDATINRYELGGCDLAVDTEDCADKYWVEATRAIRGVQLSGASELDPNGDPGAGDPDGIAAIDLYFAENTVCWDVEAWENLEFPMTGFHIHEGPSTENGPVVVPFDAPQSGWDTKGCAMDVDQALLDDIFDHPQEFYLNLHNATYPAGAVRGQLDTGTNEDPIIL